jgi:glyoxylase-like metal-dependent hydrolase (beta-lactamase superfamily II)
MSVGIHPITLGFDHCYVIQGEGIIMVDGGAPNQAKGFMEALERLSVRPEEIQLIVITHGHWDHIGSAKDIKEITGAKIAMHRREKDWLEKSLKPLPPGVTTWGRILIGTMANGISQCFVGDRRCFCGRLGDEQVPTALQSRTAHFRRRYAESKRELETAIGPGSSNDLSSAWEAILS